jgi:hypothetical protein
MKKLSILITLMIIVLSSMAQTQPRSFTFQSTDSPVNVEKETSFHFQFLFDEFQPGTIYYRNGRTAKIDLNYNILLDAVQYNQNEKLLSLFANQLDSVVISGKKLIPYENNSFAEEIDLEGGRLIVRRSIDISSETIVTGGYGQVIRTSTIRNVESRQLVNALGISHSPTLANPNNNLIEVSMRYNELYVLVRPQEEDIDINNRREVSRAFPEHRQKINNFIRQNNTDFRSADSVKELASFILSL